MQHTDNVGGLREETRYESGSEWAIARMRTRAWRERLWLIFFFKQKPAYEIRLGLVGSEMCKRDSLKRPRKKKNREIPKRPPKKTHKNKVGTVQEATKKKKKTKNMGNPQAFPYTHMTLPTKRKGEDSVVPVTLKKKKNTRGNKTPYHTTQ